MNAPKGHDLDEFGEIARLFRPLARSPEALGLLDDAAVLTWRAGHELVVTADAIVEGVHFLPEDPPQGVAQKLLRVNLSDLAAKAAEPYAYLLTVAWPSHWDEPKRTAFARGLSDDQARFGLTLLGGDTVSTPGPMSASVTMLGWARAGETVKRSGANAGDILLVSGFIGDGHLGLKAAKGEFVAEGASWLIDRFRLPTPRIALSDALRRHASAAADVSDGLLADAGHLGEASGLGVEITLEQIPLSDAAVGFVSGDPQRWLALATGGDDYEVVCTVHPDKLKGLLLGAAEAKVPLTAIGRMVQGRGVCVTFNGEPIKAGELGWRHG